MLWASSKLEVISDGKPRKQLKTEGNHLPLKLTLKGGYHSLNIPTSPISLWLNKTKPCWLGRAKQGNASLGSSSTIPLLPRGYLRSERPINVGLCVEASLGSLSETQVPAQPCCMSSFCPDGETEKNVCEFVFHSVKIRTEKIHLCKSVFLQLLFAHILYNYGQQEGIFHSHTGSIFHTKFYAGRQPALELFTCAVDRKPSDLWPVRPQQNVFIWSSPATGHIIFVSPLPLVPLF